MIEVNFTGGSMRALREQMAHFLDALYVPPTEVMTERDPEPAPKAKPQPKPVAEVAPEPEVAAPAANADGPTYDEVRAAVLGVAGAFSKDDAIALLNQFGAKKNASEIDPTRWAEVLAAAKARIEGTCS
jgi:hypothetical protein